MNKRLLALIPLAALLLGGPVQAQGRLQWRTTTCQIQQEGRILENSPCKAGFGYDTAVRAIKWQAKGVTQYDEVGRPGVQFGGPEARECLSVRYNDGSNLLICTVPTPEELGIRGD